MIADTQQVSLAPFLWSQPRCMASSPPSLDDADDDDDVSPPAAAAAATTAADDPSSAVPKVSVGRRWESGGTKAPRTGD